ncbi:MAG TPA: CoA pyrophosphatase [Rhizomicrobium sp.]|nr:CoA pyrophosphatase [Rhizomicrobium sp.]
MITERGPEGLRARLPQTPPELPLKPLRSDYDLNPHYEHVSQELVAAAVLLPIIRRRDPTLLFTRRTDHLARHAGQVSFPGGRWHPDDSSLTGTALRETEEETGIESTRLAVTGFLDAYETGTGFAILPVVALIDEGFSLRPNTEEVAEIFEVPLTFLLDPSNCGKGSREWRGHQRAFYTFAWRGHTIWGATAAILVNLRERLSVSDSAG